MRGATHRLPGLVLTDHQVEVPLDHADPGGEQLTVFAREVVAPRKRDQDLPWLLFLQGGPGAPLAPGRLNRSGWLGRALTEHRVLLLDQRGTGRSTPGHPADPRWPGAVPAEQARYLTHFRADAIVRDAELLRRALLGADTAAGSLLGQSYGGFVALTYLSLAPRGARPVLVAGGLPPLDRGPDDVYRATLRPGPGALRPAGRPLPRRRGAAGRDRRPRGGAPTSGCPPATGSRCRGCSRSGSGSGSRTGWRRCTTSSSRRGPADRAGRRLPGGCRGGHVVRRRAALRPAARVDLLPGRGVALVGPAGRGGATRSSRRTRARCCRPARWCSRHWCTGPGRWPRWREAAELLAAYDDWPTLYDRDVLAGNEVPVAAVVYRDDMYVEHAFSVETAERVGNLRCWVTSELGHDGLRSDSTGCSTGCWTWPAGRAERIGRVGSRVDKVAFVLGGGGLLGAGEVGMLRALFEAGVRARPGPRHVGRRHQRRRGRRRPHAGCRRAAARRLARAGRQRPVRRRRRCERCGTSPGPAPTCTRTSRCAPCSTEQLGDGADRGPGGAVPVRAPPASSAPPSTGSPAGRWSTRCWRAAPCPACCPRCAIGDEHFLDGGLVNSIPVGRAVALGAAPLFVLQVGRIDRPLRSPRPAVGGRPGLVRDRPAAPVRPRHGRAARRTSTCTCCRPAPTSRRGTATVVAALPRLRRGAAADRRPPTRRPRTTSRLPRADRADAAARAGPAAACSAPA